MELMHTSSKPPESMYYKPEQSAAVAIGAGGASNDDSLLMTHSANDVKYIMDGLNKLGVLPKEKTVIYTAQTDYDQCKLDGIKDAIKQQLSTVSKDGIFLLVFSGGAVVVAPNDSGAPPSCSLQPADFKPDDLTTHLTAGVIGEWLASAPIKPKHILIILDTPFAGKFSTEMVEVNKRCSSEGYSLCVLSAQDGPDKPVIINTLGYSIFTYFLMWAFRTTSFTPGLVPLMEMYEKTQECCDALSSLLVNYNPKAMELKQNTFRPRASYSVPDQVLRELHCCDSEEETDGGQLNAFEFLTKHFDGKSASKTRLHDKVHAYLETAGDFKKASALSKLNKHGLLEEKEILLTVVSSLMFSIASIQVAEDKKSVSDPNLFIYSFMVSAATISAIKCDVEFAPAEELFRRSSEYYMQVVRENGLDVRKLVGLFQKIDSETKVAN